MTRDALPPEFIPDGYIQLTDYTEEDLPALAEDIAADTNRPADEILAQLDTLVNEYKVPIADAERSARAKPPSEEGEL